VCLWQSRAQPHPKNYAPKHATEHYDADTSRTHSIIINVL
jgi:hypothetical protein